MSEDDILDIILGDTKDQEFWAHVGMSFAFVLAVRTLIYHTQHARYHLGVCGRYMTAYNRSIILSRKLEDGPRLRTRDWHSESSTHMCAFQLRGLDSLVTAFRGRVLPIAWNALYWSAIVDTATTWHIAILYVRVCA